jgi:hypothetical protein
MAESPPIDLEILDSDEEDAVIMESPPPNPAAPSPALLKKMKKTTSVVWDDFKKLPIGLDGRSRAKCKWCGKTYGSESSNGTKNMLRHIPKCPRRNHKDIEKMHERQEQKMFTRKIKQEKYREKVAKAIIKHNYSFISVEHEGNRDVHSYLNPDVKHISRNTAKADILKVHRKEKDNIRNMLKSIPGRICLTSDLWTSITTEGYICLTAHYMDENWKLKSIILNFRHMPPPHTGIALLEKIFKFLKDWGIEEKVFSITLDNAYNNDNMQDLLKEKLNLRNLLLCGGAFFMCIVVLMY